MIDDPRCHDVAVLVGDLHLDAPILPLIGHSGQRRARLLARLHSHPVGEVLVDLPATGITASDLAAATWVQLRGQIIEHLAQDGIDAPGLLPATGLDPHPDAACVTTRATAARPPITVVIATRDRTESLHRCLVSLDALDYPDYDVVVVDSAPSSDATRRALAGTQAWRYPLHYLAADRPGLALAHNTALPAVTGEIVAFTDDDVQVDPHWLTAIAEAFDTGDVACVTGLILAAELETAAQLWIEQSGGFARGFTMRRFSLAEPPADRLFPFTAGRFGSGANMAFRTDWLRTHAGFDAATGAGTPARGGDDLAAFLGVVLDGGTLVYQPAAIVRHWHRREYAGLRRQAFGYGVGLGAYLTASVWARPRLIGPMMARAVPAITHLVGSDSPKNEGKRSDFPHELTWRELAGVMAGPLAYTKSRRRYRATATTGSRR